uniref:JAB domain-containing protein n=1 Tax=candidate division WOR-3 bacterium TaxID=2052148 RepID=A0A7C6AA22_UNCW3
MKKSFTVLDLPKGERPRERLLRLGPEVLSSQEILSVILGRGTRGKSVMNIAQELLSKFGNLKAIAGASVEELCQIDGIGPAKACQIKAALELGKRVEGQPEDETKIEIKTTQDVLKVVRPRLKDKKREYFLLLLLDSRNQLIRPVDISIGSLDATVVHPREVFKEAISASAASVICVHNHPSGNPEPSEDDLNLTKRLVQAGKLLGIEVLDHIIIGWQGYYSLKSRNLM